MDEGSPPRTRWEYRSPTMNEPAMNRCVVSLPCLSAEQSDATADVCCCWRVIDVDDVQNTADPKCNIELVEEKPGFFFWLSVDESNVDGRSGGTERRRAFSTRIAGHGWTRHRGRRSVVSLIGRTCTLPSPCDEAILFVESLLLGAAYSYFGTHSSESAWEADGGATFCVADANEVSALDGARSRFSDRYWRCFPRT